jgi:hypothetical protein
VPLLGAQPTLKFSGDAISFAESTTKSYEALLFGSGAGCLANTIDSSPVNWI